MLYIVDNNDKNIEWHVGEQVPRVIEAGLKFIQADGDELSYIAERFPCLTPHSRNVVVWNEPFATLILVNL